MARIWNVQPLPSAPQRFRKSSRRESANALDVRGKGSPTRQTILPPEKPSDSLHLYVLPGGSRLGPVDSPASVPRVSEARQGLSLSEIGRASCRERV